MGWKLMKSIFFSYFILHVACALDPLNFTQASILENQERRHPGISYKPDEEQEANAIPERLLIQMKDIWNVSEFLRQFVPIEYNATVENTFATNHGVLFGNQSRKGLSAAAMPSIAKFAGCQPEDQAVRLEDAEARGAMFWPPCVRLRQCGGCCTSKMLTCRPVQTSKINFTVLHVLYSGSQANGFRNGGPKVFTLEQHDRCACSCKEEAEHCSQRQQYRAEECRCVCPNQDEAEACDGPERIWDSRDCTCICRTAQDCSTGFYFNAATCRCEALRASLMFPLRYPRRHQQNFWKTGVLRNVSLN